MLANAALDSRPDDTINVRPLADRRSASGDLEYQNLKSVRVSETRCLGRMHIWRKL
jgi:hypothetical protein